MYRSEQIQKRLNDSKHKLQGYVTYKAMSRRLNGLFNDYDDIKFKFVKYDDLDVNDYLVGGLYDPTTNKKYVIFNVSVYSQELFIEEQMWSDLVFSITQTINHETIHQKQFKHRKNLHENCRIDFRVLKGTIDEDRSYLSDLDEIEAYAHDIAMEIKHFYPHKNPYDVLNTISVRRKLSSFSYYKRTFKGCEWNSIKKRLLLKTYKWIENV